MAVAWTSVSIANVTSIGTTEKYSASTTMAADEELHIQVTLAAHSTDDITITPQVTLDGGVNWADLLGVKLDAGNVDPQYFRFDRQPEIRIALVASGGTDLPTASFVAKKGTPA